MVGSIYGSCRDCNTGSNTLKAGLNGWTAGGGVDYAPWNRLILRAEYLYESYSDRTFAFTTTVLNPISFNSHVFRGAAMVKF